MKTKIEMVKVTKWVTTHGCEFSTKREMLIAELEMVFGGHDEITPKDIVNKWPILERTMKEAKELDESNTNEQEDMMWMGE
jgi:hypothetical protein